MKEARHKYDSVQNSKTGETNLWLVVIFGGGRGWKQ